MVSGNAQLRYTTSIRKQQHELFEFAELLLNEKILGVQACLRVFVRASESDREMGREVDDDNTTGGLNGATNTAKLLITSLYDTSPFSRRHLLACMLAHHRALAPAASK